MTVYTLDPLRDARHKDARAARECADWLAHLELEGKAERTLDDYERTVAVLLRSLPDTDLVDMTDGDLAHLLRQWPIGSRRIRRAHLNSFFSWAYRMSRIERNPMERVPKMRAPTQRVSDIFTEPEYAILVMDPLLAILLDTGIRKTEARMLQRRHISTERAELVVYRGKGDKDRVIPLTSRACIAVSDLDLLERLDPEDFLWYGNPGGRSVIDRSHPVGNARFHRWYGKALDAAGVYYRNPHTTRHTYATRYLRAGGRLETLRLNMGHTSISTTLDLYGHLDLADARADVALLDLYAVTNQSREENA